jgi:hypothetical protein
VMWIFSLQCLVNLSFLHKAEWYNARFRSPKGLCRDFRIQIQVLRTLRYIIFWATKNMTKSSSHIWPTLVFGVYCSDISGLICKVGCCIWCAWMEVHRFFQKKSYMSSASQQNQIHICSCCIFQSLEWNVWKSWNTSKQDEVWRAWLSNL